MVVGKDGSGFDLFYQTEFGRLAGSLYLLTGDRRAAEEITQEAFVRAYQAWDRVAALDRPAGWVYTTAFNVARRQWKKAQRDRPESGPEMSMTHDDTVVGSVVMADALRRLPMSQRKAVVARYVLGFDTYETARMLDTTPGALRALLHRAVCALRLEPALTTQED